MGIDLLTLKKANQARVESYNRPTYGVESLSYTERRDRLRFTAQSYHLVPVANPNSNIRGYPARRQVAPASGQADITTALDTPVEAYPYIAFDYFAEDANTTGSVRINLHTDDDNLFFRMVTGIKPGVNHIVLNRVDGFSTIGSPDWSSISKVTIRGFANSNGVHQFRAGGVYTYAFRPMVSIWFDDGYGSVYSTAKPNMDTYGFKGVHSIHGRNIGEQFFLTPAQLHQMKNEGWEHVNHGYKFYQFNTATPDEIEYMMRAGLDYCLSQGFGKASWYFVNPSAQSTPVSLPIERKYATLRRIGNGYNYLPIVDTFNIVSLEPKWATPAEEVYGWIDKAIGGGLWLILLFHHIRPDDHSNTAISYPVTPFKNILSYLNDRKADSGLRVMTCSEAICNL